MYFTMMKSHKLLPDELWKIIYEEKIHLILVPETTLYVVMHSDFNVKQIDVDFLWRFHFHASYVK